MSRFESRLFFVPYINCNKLTATYTELLTLCLIGVKMRGWEKKIEGIREMGVFHYLVKKRKERGKKIEWVSPRPTNLNFSKWGGKWRKLGQEMQLQLFSFVPI